MLSWIGTLSTQHPALSTEGRAVKPAGQLASQETEEHFIGSALVFRVPFESLALGPLHQVTALDVGLGYWVAEEWQAAMLVAHNS